MIKKKYISWAFFFSYRLRIYIYRLIEPRAILYHYLEEFGTERLDIKKKKYKQNVLIVNRSTIFQPI